MFTRFIPAAGIAAAVIGTLTLTGCGSGEQTVKPAPISEKLCVVLNYAEAAGCTKGDSIYFAPEDWKNEQLTVDFAAAWCDLRYTVAMNQAGLTCVYSGPKQQIYRGLEVLQQKAAEEDKFNRELAAKLDTDKTWTKNGTTYWKTLKEGTGNPCPDNACRYTLTALKTFDHTGKATDVKTATPQASDLNNVGWQVGDEIEMLELNTAEPRKSAHFVMRIDGIENASGQTGSRSQGRHKETCEEVISD